MNSSPICSPWRTLRASRGPCMFLGGLYVLLRGPSVLFRGPSVLLEHPAYSSRTLFTPQGPWVLLEYPVCSLEELMCSSEDLLCFLEDPVCSSETLCALWRPSVHLKDPVCFEALRDSELLSCSAQKKDLIWECDSWNRKRRDLLRWRTQTPKWSQFRTTASLYLDFILANSTLSGR